MTIKLLVLVRQEIGGGLLFSPIQFFIVEGQ